MLTQYYLPPSPSIQGRFWKSVSSKTLASISVVGKCLSPAFPLNQKPCLPLLLSTQYLQYYSPHPQVPFLPIERWALVHAQQCLGGSSGTHLHKTSHILKKNEGLEEAADASVIKTNQVGIGRHLRSCSPTSSRHSQEGESFSFPAN